MSTIANNSDQQLAELMNKLCGMKETSLSAIPNGDLQLDTSENVQLVSNKATTFVRVKDPNGESNVIDVSKIGSIIEEKDKEIEKLKKTINEIVSKGLSDNMALLRRENEKLQQALEAKTEEANRLRGGVEEHKRVLRMQPSVSREVEYNIDGYDRKFRDYMLDTPEGSIEHLLICRVYDQNEYQRLSETGLHHWSEGLYKHFGKPVMVIAVPPGVEMTLTDIVS